VRRRDSSNSGTLTSGLPERYGPMLLQVDTNGPPQADLTDGLDLLCGYRVTRVMIQSRMVRMAPATMPTRMVWMRGRGLGSWVFIGCSL
jgi:hypothetical protein